MGTRKRGGVPARLESTRRRFERWRQKRELGTRIPEPLWDAAAKMAGAYGIHRTASTLGLDYYRLKKRVEENGSSPSPKVTESEKAESVATFLELPPPQTGSSECVLELEDAGGAKMRVHLKGVAAPDLAALSRSFWGLES